MVSPEHDLLSDKQRRLIEDVTWRFQGKDPKEERAKIRAERSHERRIAKDKENRRLWSIHKTHWPKERARVQALLKGKSPEEIRIWVEQFYTATGVWVENICPGIKPQKTRFVEGERLWINNIKWKKDGVWERIPKGPFYFIGSIRDPGGYMSLRIVIDDTGKLRKITNLRKTEELIP